MHPVGHLTNVALVRESEVDPEDIKSLGSALTYTDEQDVTHHLLQRASGMLIVPRGTWLASPLSSRYPLADERSTAPVSMPEPNGMLYGYQRLPVAKMTKKQGGILQAPTGSGKTRMMLHVIAAQAQRTLVIVHTKDLLAQWRTAVGDVLGIEAGIIGDARWDEGTHITIATVQTLMRYDSLPTDWVDTWGLALLDEAHRCSAVSFEHVMSQMTALHRYGCTATPTRRDGKHPSMLAVLGPVGARVNESALVKSGKLIRPKVRLVETSFHSTAALRMARSADDFQRRKNYKQMVDDLVVDDKRNAQVARIIVKNRNRHVLVLSERISHLYDIDSKVYQTHPGVRSFVMTGQTRSSEREDVINMMRTGSLNVLFATSLADEGLDIAVLDTLILPFPRRSTQKLQQQVGRIMRTFDGKTGSLVVDFVDSNIAVLRNQAKDRYAWYMDKGCDIVGWAPPMSIASRIARAKQQKG